jgi:hypothetical protein
MHGKTKRTAIIALVLGVMALTVLAAPIHAYRNGEADLLQTQGQDRDRLRTQEQDCGGCPLQARTRDQLRTQEQGCDCDCDGTQKQNQYAREEHEGAANRVQDCTMDQSRHQQRERMGS